MIGLEDRQALARDIHIAHVAGARLMLARETAGIELRTLQRWKAVDGVIRGDGRPLAVRTTPRHALSAAERARVLAVANEPRFAAVPPARWSGKTRNWAPMGAVTLNPERDCIVKSHSDGNNI